MSIVCAIKHDVEPYETHPMILHTPPELRYLHHPISVELETLCEVFQLCNNDRDVFNTRTRDENSVCIIVY
jgi:hypothetical protein